MSILHKPASIKEESEGLVVKMRVFICSRKHFLSTKDKKEASHS